MSAERYRVEGRLTTDLFEHPYFFFDVDVEGVDVVV